LVKIWPVVIVALLLAYRSIFSATTNPLCLEIGTAALAVDRPMSRNETAGRSSPSDWQERCRAVLSAAYRKLMSAMYGKR
jgi:hypothetical protein